jgi:hypothetical protein
MEFAIMNKAKREPPVSLADRLAHGNLTVEETRLLKNRSHSGFYEDVKQGRVAIEKHGRKSTIRGPIAKAYIEGRPISEVV